MNLAVARHRLRSIIDIDVADELQRIEVPVLYLMASEDRLVKAIAAKPFERPAKQWRIAKITAPHLLLQAAPREAAIEIESFVESLAGPRVKQ